MKKTLTYLTLVVYIMLVSCNNKAHDNNHEGEKNQPHIHEGETEPHTHEGEAKAEAKPHIHEGETEPHTHEGEAKAEAEPHIHEGETEPHTHEADPGVKSNKTSTVDEGMNIDMSQIDTKVIRKQPFSSVIKTSGQLIPDKSDEILITAPVNGVISYSSSNLFQGSKVNRGKNLFQVSGGNLIDNNIKIRYQQAKSSLDKLTTEYERASKLIVDKIISEKDFLQIKMEYEQESVDFDNLEGSYLNSGLSVSSPATGYINSVYVNEGEYVEQGQIIASVIKNKSIIIKAEVPQQYFTKLNSISSANIRTLYDQKLYDIEYLDGRKISAGQTANMSPYYVPVFFRINNNGMLISGSIIEVYLKTNIIEDCLVVPKTAILEEQGKYYVYVREGKKEFHKHSVVLGQENGADVRVLSGFGPNSEIVIKGAYHIKLASMSSSLPAHSH